MFKMRLVLMIALAAFIMAPVQALMLDDMSNISARGWVDNRDGAGQGAGWLSQGAGAMKVDYSHTYNHDNTAPYLLPDPLSGWDYQGNNVGVGNGAFDSALGNHNSSNVLVTPDGYLGDNDREIIGAFTFAELGDLTGKTMTLDVYKAVAGNSEHVRELQLYDSLGFRNTYQVQSEAGASTIGAGWKTYTMDLSTPLSAAADLTDIVEIRLWVTAWSAFVFQNFGSPVWPGDYNQVAHTGTAVEIKNLQLIPEPATMTMLGLGGLALLRRRKKA